MRTALIFPLLLFVFAGWAQTSFPDRCSGTWEGWMHIYSKGVLRDSVRIKHLVSPIDSMSWTWRTEYLSDKMPMVKDYVLRARDKAGIEYVIDEGAGIEIPMHLVGNRLYGIFETQGILLTATDELTPEGLILEVVSARRVSQTDSLVNNFQVNAVQRALLKKASMEKK